MRKLKPRVRTKDANSWAVVATWSSRPFHTEYGFVLSLHDDGDEAGREGGAFGAADWAGLRVLKVPAATPRGARVKIDPDFHPATPG